MMPYKKVSTDEIRQFWEDAAREQVEFDAWLVGERKRVADMAKTRERERIIALLNGCRDPQWCAQIKYAECDCQPLLTDETIALIKGEPSD